MAAGRSRVLLTVLLVSVAAANVAYTILIPFVPTLRDTLAMSPLLIGLAFGGFAAAKAATQPLGGWSVDRLGPRGTATAGLGLAAVATAAVAYAETGPWIVALRLLWGVGEGFAIPALYRLASGLGRSAGVGESRALGWFGSAAVAGMAAGPGVVALLGGALTFKPAFLGSGALTALAALTLHVGLRGLPAEAPATSDEQGTRVAGFWVVLAVLGFGLLDFVNNLVYAALEPVLPLHAVAEFGAARRDVSTVFFVGLVVFAVASALAGPLVSRLGPVRAASLSLAVQTVVLLVLAGSGAFGLFGAAFVVLMLVQPVVYVAARTGIAGVAPGSQGRAFGWFGLVSDLGWVLGPIAAGAMLPWLGGGVFVALAVATGVAVAAPVLRRLRAPAPLHPSHIDICR